MREIHTGIVLSVQASSEAEAIQRAESFNEDQARWSDWWELGGRWDSVIAGGILRYSDDPELFDEIVDDYQISTFKNLETILNDIGSLTIRELITDPQYSSLWDLTEKERETTTDSGMNRIYRYLGKKAFDIVNHQFTPDTHFYDMEEYIHTRVRLDERIASEPDKQYILVWDYHF